MEEKKLYQIDINYVELADIKIKNLIEDFPIDFET